jgi:hypothetical protein
MLALVTAPLIALMNQMGVLLAFKTTPTCGLATKTWAAVSPATNDIAGLSSLAPILIGLLLLALLIAIRTNAGKKVMSWIGGIFGILILLALLYGGAFDAWLPAVANC